MSDLTTHDMSYTQNRELSWLEFNKRVLQMAEDETVPALEKLKFVSIFTSNLSEFFMVRVGSLFDLANLKKEGYDNKTGLTYSEQLEHIYNSMPPLYALRDRIFASVSESLSKYEVSQKQYDTLSKEDKKYVDNYFERNVQPLLSPLIIDARHPFPHLLNQALYIITEIKSPKNSLIYGVVSVTPILEPMVILPGLPVRYLLMEDLILAQMQNIFPGFSITQRAIVCVTRNADINLDEEIDDADENFRAQMRKALKKRARLAPVRLEVRGELSKPSLTYLINKLNIKKNQVYTSTAPLKMEYAFGLADHLSLETRKKVTYEPFIPVIPSSVDMSRSIMEQVAEKDLLLHFPYESMEPFLKMIKEASNDPAVISIKITIYRLASISKVAEYLSNAAENGKDVTVLMELRARFDERNNIDWSERLEAAGCTIIYGFEEYKVHSKICLITRHINNQITYITQIGTGNYNEKTAKQYTDFSLITANQEIGIDASNFFKNMFISKLDGTYKHLMVAPYGMRPALTAYIDNEIQKVQRGEPGRIIIKCNSITERDLIDKLSEASQAGVKIYLIIRGICCILPGIPDKSENIHVRSIVGRYLEHHRIFVFGSGPLEEVKVFISSADLMTRNISRRVELACPIYDIDLKQRVLDILDLFLESTTKAKELLSDGSYIRIPEDEESSQNVQRVLTRLAIQDAKKSTLKKLKASATEKKEPVTASTDFEADTILTENIITSPTAEEIALEESSSPTEPSAEMDVAEIPPEEKRLSLFQRILQWFSGR